MAKRNLAKSTRSSSSSREPLPNVISILSEGIARTLNPSLLGWQALMLMITLFAFVVIGGFFALSVFLVSLLAIATGFLPLALFIIIFGFAVGLLLLMAVNAFVDGVHYHLSMQAVSRRPIDFDLAWKLASARWKDAVAVQGSVVTMIISAILVSILAGMLIRPPAEGWSWLANPSTWSHMLGVPFLIVMALLVAIQPFLFFLLPSVYFDNATPSQTFKRLFHSVKPRYWLLMLSSLGVIALNILIGTFSDVLTTSLAPTGAPFPDTLAVLAATLVQLGSILVTFSVTVNIQTVAYVRMVPQKGNIQFVSKDFVARALARMAKDKPHHSGRLPVKWKTPARKR